jgi:hypothetical protein
MARFRYACQPEAASLRGAVVVPWGRGLHCSQVGSPVLSSASADSVTLDFEEAMLKVELCVSTPRGTGWEILSGRFAISYEELLRQIPIEKVQGFSSRGPEPAE